MEAMAHDFRAAAARGDTVSLRALGLYFPQLADSALFEATLAVAGDAALPAGARAYAFRLAHRMLDRRAGGGEVSYGDVPGAPDDCAPLAAPVSDIVSDHWTMPSGRPPAPDFGNRLLAASAAAARDAAAGREVRRAAQRCSAR
jgi:hypothetical protein